MCESARRKQQGFVNHIKRVNALLTLFFVTEPIRVGDRLNSGVIYLDTEKAARPYKVYEGEISVFYVVVKIFKPEI